jgi:3-hydroxyacyl-CoA dehydrogenase
MVDDGMEISHIEAVARKTFGIDRGFLAQMDEIGILKTCAFLEEMSDTSQDDDPIFQKYYNFFKPGLNLQEKCRKGQQAGSALLWKADTIEDKEPDDIALIDLLRKRFQAVAFIISVEVVEAGLLEIGDIEKTCLEVFGWKEGPFAMMNRLGLEETMRKVTEKMEMSHRQEINFPIPKLLITQARKNEPWPLNSRIQ